jgi:hypothetical protein
MGDFKGAIRCPAESERRERKSIGEINKSVLKKWNVTRITTIFYCRRYTEFIKV